MTTVKVLVDGVGNYNAGDVVPNASVGLVEMAENETRNAATGEILVEIVDDVTDEYEALKAQAKELKIKGYANMKFDTLKAAVEAANEAIGNQQPPKGDDPNQNPLADPAVNENGQQNPNQ